MIDFQATAADWQRTGPYEPASPVADAPLRSGHYEIVRELGRGGMGVVYQARLVGLERSRPVGIGPGLG